MNLKKMKSNRISFIFQETIIFLLMVYEGWYLEKFPAIPFLLQVLTVILVLITVMQGGFLKSLNEGTIKVWLLMIISCFFGAALSSEPHHAYTSLFTFLSFFIVSLCSLSTFKRNPRLLHYIMITIGILTVTSIIISPYEYKNGLYGVITMGENNNPNGLGFTMALSAYFLLLAEQTESNLTWLIKLVVSCFLVIITINSGSRSGLICTIFVIGFAVFSKIFLRKSKTRGDLLFKTLLIIIVITIISFGQKIIFAGGYSGGLDRLVNLFKADSFGGRLHLYEAAWKIFCSFPVFGIGFNCFAVLSGYGYYTHSTYMELLACTGFLGTALFLIPFFKGLINSFVNQRKDNGKMFILLMFFVINGFFSIWFYNLNYMIILLLSLNILNKGDYYEKIF